VGTMLGLHSLTPQELTPLASGALVRAILPEADGSVWVGTANGLVQFRQDGGTWRGGALSAKGNIRSLFRDARGHAWAETELGLRALIHGRLVQVPGPTRHAQGPAAPGNPPPARPGRPILAAIGPPSAPAPGGQQSVDAVFEDAHGTVWAGGTA